MNAKKVKAIRKNLRDSGIDFRDVDYDYKIHVKSQPGRRPYTTEQWFLYQGCGRQIYQQAKRGARHG